MRLPHLLSFATENRVEGPAPLRLDRCETLCFRDPPAIRVGPWQPLRVGYLSLKGRVGIHVKAGVDPGDLNAGLMKPRRGFTWSRGTKTGGKLILLLDKISA